MSSTFENLDCSSALICNIAGRRRSTLGVDIVPVSDFDNKPDDQDCIKTPEEYMAVWRSEKASERDRCVDPNIIVRLYTGDAVCETLDYLVYGKFLQRLSPLSFWSNKVTADSARRGHCMQLEPHSL